MRYTYSTLKENGIKLTELTDPTAMEFCCSWPWGMPSGFLSNATSLLRQVEPPGNILLEELFCCNKALSLPSSPGARGCNRFHHPRYKFGFLFQTDVLEELN